MTSQGPLPACGLGVRVAPKARIADVRIADGVVRVRVTAAPEEGRASLGTVSTRRGPC